MEKEPPTEKDTGQEMISFCMVRGNHSPPAPGIRDHGAKVQKAEYYLCGAVQFWLHLHLCYFLSAFCCEIQQMLRACFLLS